MLWHLYLPLGHLPPLLEGILKISAHVPIVRPLSLISKGEEQTLISENCVCLFGALWGLSEGLMKGSFV